jgi:glucose/arabinose dehydrogenase
MHPYNWGVGMMWVYLLLNLVFGACAGIASSQATATPAPSPVASPTAISTPRPQATPTAQASPSPAATAVAASTGTPTPVPTPRPSPSPTPVPTPVAAPLARMDVEQVFPAISFSRMVALAYPNDGTNRAFLVLQPGQIMVFDDDQNVASASVFLDIRERVNDSGNEEGLLGLAFDPDFKDNGYFYVDYTASPPRRNVVSRFSVSKDNPNVADPNSERVIIQNNKPGSPPYSNHNGGQVIFGPDGYLYWGWGDGGSGGDPHKNGQNLSVLLGKILRIDVSTLDSQGKYSIPPDNPFVGRSDARGEIWAYGLRNPWRFTFDRLTGDMWAADVGQNRYEEVDIIKPGGNYGWNIMEGAHCYNQPTCNTSGLELPLAEYHQDEGGCSVTGGYVYRGARLPSLYGAYVYGDFCSGKIWALRHDGSKVTERMEIVDSSLRISSFAEHPSGELYILSFDNKIYRLKARD